MGVLLVLLLSGMAVVFVGFKLLIGLVMLPFKILGLVLKGLGGLVSVLFGVLGLVAAILMLPLLPLVILGGLVYLIVRAARPRPLPGEVRLIRG
jgi:hypothetical protein